MGRGVDVGMVGVAVGVGSLNGMMKRRMEDKNGRFVGVFVTTGMKNVGVGVGWGRGVRDGMVRGAAVSVEFIE